MGAQVPTALKFRSHRTRGEPDGHPEKDRQGDEGQSTPATRVAIPDADALQEEPIFLITNHRFAGLSANRLMYHGNQAVP